MNTTDIILFVFDTKENFEKSKTNLGGEGWAFKKIVCIEGFSDFEREFANVANDEYVFMVVHVFYTDDIQGLRRFASSRLAKKYPNLGFMYISEGDYKAIQKQMIDFELDHARIYKYHQVQSTLEDGDIKVFKKNEILKFTPQAHNEESEPKQKLQNENIPNCDYAIITALEEEEMEKVLPYITKTGTVNNNKHLIEFGHLTSNPSKVVAYASQLQTGMVDAAILATELILTFKPKFLIMAGVLGGKPNDVNIGDVVVATKVFTPDKGKISELGFRIELESNNTDSSSVTRLKRNKGKIIEHIKQKDITRSKSINIHFGSIACVRQVIDIEGYFEDKITAVDRKAIALEMESYGVSRACDIVNNGSTTPLIIKSVMDNTKDKNDDAKSYAAWTSAETVFYILSNDLI